MVKLNDKLIYNILFLYLYKYLLWLYHFDIIELHNGGKIILFRMYNVDI